MPVKIRRDLMYAMLSHIQALEQQEMQPKPALSERDFTNLDATPAEIIGHIDYLYQKALFTGVFEPGSYGDRDLEQGVFEPQDKLTDYTLEDPINVDEGEGNAGVPARQEYGEQSESTVDIEAQPNIRDVVPISGAVDVDRVRLTAAGRAALAELEKKGHAPEPSQLS
ncbi:MAG: hypothetical protein H7Y22_05430 [Gemmatimonadaceae bacterium]|nr:hypothetical protein [Gloeobacterales cyanobacterium ES-bin-141]